LGQCYGAYQGNEDEIGSRSHCDKFYASGIGFVASVTGAVGALGGTDGAAHKVFSAKESMRCDQS